MHTFKKEHFDRGEFVRVIKSFHTSRSLMSIKEAPINSNQKLIPHGTSDFLLLSSMTVSNTSDSDTSSDVTSVGIMYVDEVPELLISSTVKS